jgi:uncharacterized protein YuzE
MRFTYDPIADAAFLYLVDEIQPGQVKESRWVPLRMKDASVIVSVDEDGQALGVEFLGASKQLGSLLLEAAMTAEQPRPDSGSGESGV